MQDESKSILKTALPQNRYFTVLFISLVQKSSFYCEIKDFLKCMCVLEKYKSLGKICTFALLGIYSEIRSVLYWRYGYMTNNEELNRIYNLFTDCWRFFKKYSEVKDTDEYWEAVVNESVQIANRYNNCKFVRDLLFAVTNELERKAKEMIKNAETQQRV